MEDNCPQKVPHPQPACHSTKCLNEVEARACFRTHSHRRPVLRCELLAASRRTKETSPINDRSYRKCAGEDAPGVDGGSGRRTFDKTVSSKPLAFAADAAPMSIQWRFGTRVRVGVGIFGRWIGHFGGLIADGERRYVEDFGVSLVMRSGEASRHTSDVRGAAVRILDPDELRLRAVNQVLPFR